MFDQGVAFPMSTETIKKCLTLKSLHVPTKQYWSSVQIDQNQFFRHTTSCKKQKHNTGFSKLSTPLRFSPPLMLWRLDLLHSFCPTSRFGNWSESPQPYRPPTVSRLAKRNLLCHVTVTAQIADKELVRLFQPHHNATIVKAFSQFLVQTRWWTRRRSNAHTTEHITRKKQNSTKRFCLKVDQRVAAAATWKIPMAIN